MNDSDRAALVEELAEAMGLAFVPGDQTPGPEEVAACLPIIDRLLTTRDHADLTSAYLAGVEKGKEQAGAVDDDAVERAARALWNVDDGERSVHDPTWDKAVEIGASAVDLYREMARAALTAAAPGLDDLLPYDWNFEVRYEGEGMSTLPWLGRPEPTEDEVYYVQVGPWDAHASGYFEGTGPTRTAAIQAAVANAKKGAGQ